MTGHSEFEVVWLPAGNLTLPSPFIIRPSILFFSSSIADTSYPHHHHYHHHHHHHHHLLLHHCNFLYNFVGIYTATLATHLQREGISWFFLHELCTIWPLASP